MSAHLGTRLPALLRGAAMEHSPARPKTTHSRLLPAQLRPLVTCYGLLERKSGCLRLSKDVPDVVSGGKAQLFRTGETFSQFLQRCRVRARTSKLRNTYARPYTQQEQAAAVVPGIPDARIWADDPAVSSARRSVVVRVSAKQPVVLALSGGGADGAFGASLLAGWSARGTRPQFTIVTGASAGALIAPFAFLDRHTTKHSRACLRRARWRTCSNRRDRRDCSARVFSRQNRCAT
jgi:lambda repressor-like predicted transcriptional regulator